MDLHQATATHCYCHLRLALLDEVKRHQRAYGGDHDELVAEANLLFCRAWATHDPAKGPFGPRLRYSVRMGLRELAEKEARRKRLLVWQDTDPDWLEAPDTGRWHRLLAMLGPQARAIAELATGPHLDTLVPARAKPSQKRAAIMDLLAEAGWCLEEILRSFREIGEAIG